MKNELHNRVRARLEALNMTPEGASRAAGFDRNYLRKMFERPESLPRSPYLVKLAKVLQVTPQWLLSGPDMSGLGEDMPRYRSADPMLPVYGLAAGSLAGQSVMMPEPVEFVACPPGLINVRDAYVLIVKGTSMEPRYMEGEPLFIHPHKPVRPGDHAVVQVQHKGNGDETLTWVKRFKGEKDDELVVEQYNPKAEMRFKRVYVRAIHRVLTPNELFGV